VGLKRSIPILTYHNVSTPASGGQWANHHVTPARFLTQMTWLKRLGIRGLSLRDAEAVLNGDAGARVVVITFADCVENALPILSRVGFTATCFLVSSRIGDFNRWDDQTEAEMKPTMSTDQAAAWQAAGMEIGSHTSTHPHLTRCGAAECEREVFDSKRDLEQMFGQPVSSFCYPYGDFDDAVAQLVRAAGYRFAVTTRRGWARPATDSFALPRLGVNGTGHLVRFLSKVIHL
jgi:peptidoglycan/xylan/chitin deacetylase (PgdA/CDA1 family)